MKSGQRVTAKRWQSPAAGTNGGKVTCCGFCDTNHIEHESCFEPPPKLEFELLRSLNGLP